MDKKKDFLKNADKDTGLSDEEELQILIAQQEALESNFFLDDVNVD